MGENIEVKDVQKTEYLDKNGLDMLWAKIKENTNNQVEVERNRAVAKEDNITNSLSEFASKTTVDGQYFRASVHSYDIIGTFSEEYGLGTAWLSDYSGIPRLTIRNPKRMDNTALLTASYLSITDYYGLQIIISPDGVAMSERTTKDIVTANNSTAHIGLDDDQTKYTYVAPLENGKVPAKYLDLSQIDTSDFVSKTATDAQIINSDLTIVGGDKVIQMVDTTVGEDPVVATLSPAMLEFDGCDRSTIELNASDANSNNGSRIIIEAYNENPEITLQGTIGSDYAFQNNLTITNEGISSTDNNANHVYATDGSIADLTQYAKKSEITTGGNVDDVQVNGTTVVENKIANIKPATKESLGVVKVGDGLNVTDGTISVDTTAIGSGKYIPYESINDKLYVTKHNEGILFESGSGNVSIQNGEIGVKNSNRRLALTSSFIWLLGSNDYGEGNNTLFAELNKNGLRLRGGDNNHVLTSYGSTIDITQYAKKIDLPTVPTKVSQLQNDSEFIAKSAYDEKIAALEARIAALEAKHVETD